MSGNTQPIFVAVANTGNARIATANANRDGTGTVATLFTAGANGSRVDRVTIKATGTTTAGMIRFYEHDGANFRLVNEVLVTAITPSGVVAAFSAEWSRTDGLPVWSGPTGHTLRVSTQNAEQADVVAWGGDF